MECGAFIAPFARQLGGFGAAELKTVLEQVSCQRMSAPIALSMPDDLLGRVGRAFIM